MKDAYDAVYRCGGGSPLLARHLSWVEVCAQSVRLHVTPRAVCWHTLGHLPAYRPPSAPAPPVLEHCSSGRASMPPGVATPQRSGAPGSRGGWATACPHAPIALEIVCNLHTCAGCVLCGADPGHGMDGGGGMEPAWRGRAGHGWEPCRRTGCGRMMKRRCFLSSQCNSGKGKQDPGAGE